MAMIKLIVVIIQKLNLLVFMMYEILLFCIFKIRIYFHTNLKFRWYILISLILFTDNGRFFRHIKFSGNLIFINHFYNLLIHFFHKIFPEYWMLPNLYKCHPFLWIEFENPLEQILDFRCTILFYLWFCFIHWFSITEILSLRH